MTNNNVEALLSEIQKELASEKDIEFQRKAKQIMIEIKLAKSAVVKLENKLQKLIDDYGKEENDDLFV